MEKMNDAALKRIKDGGDDKVESKVCNKKYSNTRKKQKRYHLKKSKCSHLEVLLVFTE